MMPNNAEALRSWIVFIVLYDGYNQGLWYHRIICTSFWKQTPKSHRAQIPIENKFLRNFKPDDVTNCWFLLLVSEISNILFQATRLITSVGEIKASNLKLSKNLEDAMDRYELLASLKTGLENQLENIMVRKTDYLLKSAFVRM